MDIEQLKKITGMSEAELSSYILDRYNNGATNEEIWNELAVGKLKDTNPELSNKLIQERKDRLARNGWDEPWETYFTKETFPSWRSHTTPEGNSTPDDNGWTDLKKLGSTIGSGLKKAFTPNKAIDPLWQLGVIEDAFGDDSKFKMWNQNVESRKQREAQYEYNKMLKAMDEAQAAKEKSIAAAKSASDERIASAKAQKETDEKNLDTFLSTLDKLNTGKKLTETENTILNVQYNRLNDSDKAAYADVFDKLSSETVSTDELETPVEPSSAPSSAPKFGTAEEQSKYKTYVASERERIAAMPNGSEKQAAMKKLNSYINSNTNKVEGGLGKQYNTKDINSAAAPKPVKEWKISDKWSGLYKDRPKLSGRLKWTKTGNFNDKNEPEFVVEAK